MHWALYIVMRLHRATLDRVCVVTVWKWMQCGGLGYSDQCFYAGADEIILNSGEGIQ